MIRVVYAFGLLNPIHDTRDCGLVSSFHVVETLVFLSKILVGLKSDPCGEKLGLSRPIHEGDNGL